MGARKAGHSGTLDPNATGMLLIGLDNAARLLGTFMGLDKAYEGIIKIHGDVTVASVRGAAKSFVGEVKQLPPKKSAVARKERMRMVFSFRIHSINGREVHFSLQCQSGFYVRKLAHDLGIKLGVNAQLWELRRTAIGPFGIGECVTLDELRRKGNTSIIPSGGMIERVSDTEPRSKTL